MSANPHGQNAGEWESHPDRKPWDADPQWTRPRVEAFTEYRDFGPGRNIRAVAQRLHKSYQLIGLWSREDRWVMRVAQYDAHLDALRRAEREEQIMAMTRRHADTLSATWEVLAAPAQELARRMAQGAEGIDLREVPTKELMGAAAAASKVLPSLVQAERLVRGVSTEIVGVSTATDKNLEDADAYLVGMDTGDEALVDAPVEAPKALEQSTTEEG